MKIYQHIIPALVLSTFSLPTIAESSPNQANDINNYVTVTGYLGSRMNIDTENGYTNKEVDVSSELTQAIALGWSYAKNSEGELLFSSSKQNFSSEGDFDLDVYVQYLHFGGRIFFKNSTPFSSSIGLGMGATYFNPSNDEYDDDFAFSTSISGGLRYQLNEQFALRSDLRLYATLLDDDNKLFCSNSGCLLNVSDNMYVEAELLAGIEYKF